MTALNGQVAIVTGASSGIGHATAKLFAREGAATIVTARRQTELDELAAEIERTGGRTVAIAGDVKDEELHRRLVATAVDRFGGLDIAFNNAGIVGEMKPVNEFMLDEWRETLDTNLTGAFLGAKHQIPPMRERGGGSLIFTSSFVGYGTGFPGMGAYAASKAGLVGLTQVIAAEYGAAGIRANAILPGGTDTRLNFANAPDATPEIRAFVENLHALKRIAAPEEIAQSALYLASAAASFITGTALKVDGGASVSRS